MDIVQIERISKALADETRLAVYEAIAANSGMTCCELVQIRDVTPATISHHMKILVDAGLIQCSKKGQFVHSQVVRGIIKDYAKALERLAAGTARTRAKKRRA
jgi:ArsR family transcriptional regulator, arsenate/arsenite/antimonite-responsive transcriptional repressor